MSVETLVRERLPHAPQMGLYVAPDIPEAKLRAARSAYGSGLDEPALALYDATRFGTGRSGALFGAHRFCFQNLIETPQHVAYTDLVGIDTRKSLLGGRRLVLVINRARATFEHEMDFSARAEALPYVEAFLREALVHPLAASPARRETGASAPAAGADEAIALLEQQAAVLTPEQRRRLERLLGRA